MAISSPSHTLLPAVRMLFWRCRAPGLPAAGGAAVAACAGVRSGATLSGTPARAVRSTSSTSVAAVPAAACTSVPTGAAAALWCVLGASCAPLPWPALAWLRAVVMWAAMPAKIASAESAMPASGSRDRPGRVTPAGQAQGARQHDWSSSCRTQSQPPRPSQRPPVSQAAAPWTPQTPTREHQLRLVEAAIQEVGQNNTNDDGHCGAETRRLGWDARWQRWGSAPITTTLAAGPTIGSTRAARKAQRQALANPPGRVQAAGRLVGQCFSSRRSSVPLRPACAQRPMLTSIQHGRADAQPHKRNAPLQGKARRDV